MIRLLVDEDFNNDILTGAVLRAPQLDILRVQDVGLRGKDDPVVLLWAAERRRVTFTHDRRTMEPYAYQRVAAGLAMPGLFVVSQHSRLLARSRN